MLVGRTRESGRVGEARLLPVYCSFALSGLCLLGLGAAINALPENSWTGLGFLMFAGFCFLLAAAVLAWIRIRHWGTTPPFLRAVAIANVLVPIASVFAFFEYAR